MTQSIDQPVLQEEAPNVKPRKVIFALLFALFFPGMGQVYNGQWKKGMAVLILMYATVFVFGYTRWITWFAGLVALCSVQIILYIFQLVDAIRCARKNKNYTPRAFNTWYWHLTMVILVLALQFFYDTASILGIQTFSMPTPANAPTIQVGDRVTADLWAYSNHEPERNDLIIFKGSDGFTYCFRIVALPGEEVYFHNDSLEINHVICPKLIGKIFIDDHLPTHEYIETLPGNKNHKLRYVDANVGLQSNHTYIKLSSTQYFVMGDCRYNAADSRFIGPVERSNILGKMVYAWWGASTDRIGINLR